MLERLDQHLRIATGSQQMPFGGVHVVFAGDLYQLPPPKGLPCFASWLWRALELCELQGNQRAARDPSWAALLARARVGKWTANDIAELKRLVIKKKGNNRKQPAPKAVHWYATRKAVADYNREHLYVHAASNGWLRVHVSPASDVHVKSGAPVPEDLIWARPEDTGGLETLLRLAVGARVMLRHNIDVPDGLVNGACGTVAEIEVDPDSQEVVKVWVDFEKQAGSRWCAEHETTSVGIVRRTAQYLDKQGSKAERRQFPLVLAKATTMHKSQAATYHDGVHARRLRCHARRPSLCCFEPLPHQSLVLPGPLQPEQPQIQHGR